MFRDLIIRCEEAKRHICEASIAKFFPLSGRGSEICRVHPSSGTSYHLLPHRGEGRNAASPFTLHFSLKQRAAFTLAEVLITLGVIGVVAAMTMSVLITNYQKHVTVNRLKKSVSSLSQAMTRAQADYGDMSGWNFLQPGDNLTEDAESVREKRETFVKNYIMQYMQIVKDCGPNNINKCYDYTVSSLDRSSFKMMMSYGRMFLTADGALYSIAVDSTITTDDDGKPISVSTGDLLVNIDINGAQGPNLLGRDVFLLQLDPSDKKLKMFGAGVSRDVLKNDSWWGCNSRTSKRYYCGALIEHDSWQIKDDYLWK